MLRCIINRYESYKLYIIKSIIVNTLDSIPSSLCSILKFGEGKDKRLMWLEIDVRNDLSTSHLNYLDI